MIHEQKTPAVLAKAYAAKYGYRIETAGGSLHVFDPVHLSPIVKASAYPVLLRRMEEHVAKTERQPQPAVVNVPLASASPTLESVFGIMAAPSKLKYAGTTKGRSKGFAGNIENLPKEPTVLRPGRWALHYECCGAHARADFATRAEAVKFSRQTFNACRREGNDYHSRGIYHV